jgi:hypothetical protein
MILKYNNEVLRPCYLVIDQLAFLKVDFPPFLAMGYCLSNVWDLRTTKYNFLVL